MSLFKIKKNLNFSYDKVCDDGEWLTKEQFGFFITTGEDLFSQQYKKKIIELIREFLEIIKPLEADLFRYGENTNYYKKFTKERLEACKSHLIKFRDNDETLHYEIDIKKGCGKENTVGEFRIYIGLDGLVKYFKKKGKDGGGHEVCVYIPKDLKKSEKVLSLIKKYYSLLKCHYGYINPVLAYNYVPVETSWVLREYVTKNQYGILDIPAEITSPFFANKVNGAQWGNFISNSHIEVLGGKKKILAELKDFIIEELEPKTLFIKMPFHLPLKEDKNVIKYYKRLAKFFEPIYSPTWYGGKTGVVADANKYYKRFLK